MLIGCTAAVLGVHRYGAHTVWGRVPRPLLLAVCLALGAGVLMATGSLFAEMMEVFDAGEEIGQFDVRLTETLARELPPAALQFFGYLTRLGDPLPLTVLVVALAGVLLVRRHTMLALGWVVACAGAGLLNQALKRVFERVRPVHRTRLCAGRWLKLSQRAHLGFAGGVRHAGVSVPAPAAGALACAQRVAGGRAGLQHRLEPRDPAGALGERRGGRLCAGRGLAHHVHRRH